jgi:hypothetical protein
LIWLNIRMRATFFEIKFNVSVNRAPTFASFALFIPFGLEIDRAQARLLPNSEAFKEGSLGALDFQVAGVK